MKTWKNLALAGLMLAQAGTLLGAASPIVNNFSTAADLAGWGLNFGTGTIEWDNTTPGPDSTTGVIKFTLDATNAANKEIGPIWELGAQAFNSADYISVEYDLMVDPASGLDNNGVGTFGNWQEVLRDSGWSWDSHWVGSIMGAGGVWTHYKFAVPNNAKTYPRVAFALQGTAPYSTNVIVYMDNLVITPFQNPLVASTFDTVDQASTWSGGGRATTSFDAKNAGGGAPGSGSLKVDVAYDATTGWTEGTINYTMAFAPPRYTYVAFDVYIENPNNLTSMGIIQLFLNKDGWKYVGGQGVSAAMVGQWTHIEWPLPANVADCNGFIFQVGGNDMAAPLTYYLDNVKVYKPVTAPTVALTKAGPSGVQITMDDNGSQWQRDAIATPEAARLAGASFFWAAQPSYPVTYSFTITNFPDATKHEGFEAHMYIVNGDTGNGTGDETTGSADWNAADIFMFRLENLANGQVACRIDWKTNLPDANPLDGEPYHPVYVTAPSALGTWSLTFTSLTNATVTGPGITATNFTVPEEAVLANFSPMNSFIQFGMFKNDNENDGHNNQARGTYSRVQFTGGSYPFDDSFNGSTLTNNYAWRVTRAAAVTHVPQGTAWYVDWSLPADGYSVVCSPDVTGPWSDASVTNTFQRGARVYGAVPGAALPAGNATFFRLSKPE